MQNNVQKIKEEIDLILKKINCLKTKEYIHNSFLNLKDEIQDKDISNDIFIKLSNSLKSFSSFIPIFEKKNDICFYINHVDGNMSISCLSEKKDILNIIIEDNLNINYCCVKGDDATSVHTGNIKIYDDNYQEIDTLFLILNF